MLNEKKTDYMSGALLIGFFVLVVEVGFFNQGLIVSLLLSLACVYVGRKKKHRLYGKALFWIGIFSLAVNVINMMAFRLLILAIMLYILIHYFKSKHNPQTIQPHIREPNNSEQGVIRKQPLFGNKLLGITVTPEEAYEWNDITIQSGIGDTVIDLSYTVLPKGEAVISIRNVIGNVKVLIPYEIELSVHHSVMLGSTAILEHREQQIFNQTLSYQTEEYEHAVQKVKIITSMLVGNLEVKRI